MNTQTSTLQPGTFVGDLQVSSILGVGKSDVTYLVTDPAIGTRFALKEYFPSNYVSRQDGGLLTPLDDQAGKSFQSGLKQFLNEARIVAAFEHPGIVKVLRYFEANGTAYYLMPYYQGKPLQKWLEPIGKLNREDARKLMISLMDALDYIHGQGVIHQDINPGNIYITQNDVPVLLDFAVASSESTDPSSARSSAKSASLAPEQLRPDGDIGPWTDIYALSACMYEAISGQRPQTAAERQEMISRGENDPLVAFSELAPAGLYGGLTDVIEQGLKFPARERPRQVGQWQKSFKSMDWHRSIVVAGSDDAYEKEKKEWLPLVLLGVFVVALAGIGIYLLFGKTPDKFPVTFNEDKPAIKSSGVNAVEQAEPTSEELKHWQAALKADTIIGYRKFILDFPESVYRPQAEIQLNILDEKTWQELSAENTIPAYEHYLRVFPAGLHQADALQRIEAFIEAEAKRKRLALERQKRENQAWETAINTRTIAAMDQYITNWPAGANIEEARRIRRLLKDQSEDNKAFQTARNLNTKDAFQAYIDAFPRGNNVANALQRMDDLTLRPGKTFKDCEGCPSMVVVATAAYWQGSDESSDLALEMEKPRRLVTIDEPFAVGVYEVTMAEWDLCHTEGGCTSKPADNGWGRGNRPVIMVSWNDAEQYVHWISEKSGQTYRLPSESEWEYFARAGQEGDWPGGDIELVCTYGNIAGAETGFRWQHEQCNDKLALGTAPVGTFKANAFGLYDTTGNVSEWTADCMNLSYIDAPVDGSAWGRGICSSHMTRGGSWITGTREIRLPARFNLKNGDRNDFTGFRVVREIDE